MAKAKKEVEPPNLSELFANELIAHTVDLTRFSESVRRRVVGRLMMLQDDLVQKVMALDPERFTDREKIRRLQRLLEQTDNTIKSAFRDVRDSHLNDMTSLAKLENKFVPQMFSDTFGFDIVDPVFTPEQLKVIAKKSLIQGSPSEEWWGRQSASLRNAFSDQMRMGYLSNENVGDLVIRVRGKATGKRLSVELEGESKTVPEFQGGIMDTSTRNADALVRTSIQSIAEDVRLQTYQGNADVIKGIQAHATLDGRTTMLCKARDHHAWYLDDYRAIPPTVEPYPGSPPWHFRCRTTFTPVTYSWEELATRAKSSKNAKRIARKVDRNIDEGTRASMDGQVSKSLDYEDWLRTRPIEVQKDFLGPGRYELWTEKKLTFEQMVDQRGNPLTIDEIEARIKSRRRK